MARTAPRPEPTITKDLRPQRVNCPHCGKPMRADYANRRTVATLDGLTRLNLTIRRCHNGEGAARPTTPPGRGKRGAGPARRKPYRPEAEGRLALPHHEFGLDVIALVGRLRYAFHRSVPEIRAHLAGRGLSIAERTVTNLLDRY